MDYQYRFGDFTDDSQEVRITDQRTSETFTVGARLGDAAFRNTHAGCLSSILADVVDLAASIFISDWLLPRKLHNRHSVCVELPVRHPRLFSYANVQNELHGLLQWYTGDDWHFEFRSREARGRASEQQPALPLPSADTEVALWSGGLDSLAGLYGRIANQSASQFTLLGTGSSTQMLGKQEEIFSGLREMGVHNVKLIQIPIWLSYPGRRPRSNDLFRARGLVFQLLGAVCALLEGQHVLHIYENGFGAINLPFTKAETGLSHTRSVHPLSILGTSALLEKLFDSPFHYCNPYQFVTKTQMVAALKEQADLAFSTVSCDGRYRQAEQPSQCGHCSSCLLRRMALLNVLGQDETEYAVARRSGTSSPAHGAHFRAMDYQVSKLKEILASAEPWRHLQYRYPGLRTLVIKLARDSGESESQLEGLLLDLYRSHVNEWESTRQLLQVC